MKRIKAIILGFLFIGALQAQVESVASGAGQAGSVHPLAQELRLDKFTANQQLGQVLNHHEDLIDLVADHIDNEIERESTRDGNRLQKYLNLGDVINKYHTKGINTLTDEESYLLLDLIITNQKNLFMQLKDLNGEEQAEDLTLQKETIPGFSTTQLYEVAVDA